MTRRSWVVWLAALLAVAGTARLGEWQLDRAAQKTALHEARLRQAGAPPLTMEELPRTAAQARALEHRRVLLAGRWLPVQTILLDNRPMAGRTGFVVLTPLALESGEGEASAPGPGAGLGPGPRPVVLVQRGWWPRDAQDRTRAAVPAPAPGTVHLAGRLALSPSRLFELGPDSAGAIRQNLDVDAFARESGLALLPWVLVQIEDAAAPAADGLLRQWPEPAADVHKHYGYAFQWFALATLLIVLVAWFQVIRPRRARRRSSP